MVGERGARLGVWNKEIVTTEPPEGDMTTSCGTPCYSAIQAKNKDVLYILWNIFVDGLTLYIDTNHLNM